MPSLQLLFNIKPLNKRLELTSFFNTGGMNNEKEAVLSETYSETVETNYDFWIDWGDGTEMEHYNNKSKKCSDNGWQQCIQVVHTYERSDKYRITIYGTCDALHGYYTAKPEKTRGIRECLYGIVVPKNRTSPIKYAYGSFFGCQNLKYFGKGVLDNLAEDAYTLEHLFDGASLEYVYPNIFYGCKNVKHMGWVLEACMMKFLHSNIFRWTPNVRDMQHAFHRCILLKTVPNGLFDYVPMCKSFHTTFKTCTSLESAPIDLFDKCYGITDVSRCFAGGRFFGDWSYDENMYIKQLPHIWNHVNIENINVTDYARGCKLAGYPVFSHINDDGTSQTYTCTHTNHNEHTCENGKRRTPNQDQFLGYSDYLTATTYGMT